MVEDARRMRALLRRKGYRSGHDLHYVEEPGAAHHEAAWAGRLGAALHFLLLHTRGARERYQAPLPPLFTSSETVVQGRAAMPDAS